MNISELKTVADLASLNLTDEESSLLGKDIETMMDCFAKMKEAAPDAFLADREKLPAANRFRGDVRTEDVSPDRILEGAPELEDRFIVIPNVL